jgi:hypothetical protein
MGRSADDFVSRLVTAVPKLAPVYQQHFADNDELLPHVFMGDVTRFAIANAEHEDSAGSLSALLALLESELNSSDSEVAELIGVSFVENLCGEDDAIQLLLPRMGEALRQEMRRICGI